MEFFQKPDPGQQCSKTMHEAKTQIATHAVTVSLVMQVNYSVR